MTWSELGQGKTKLWVIGTIVSVLSSVITWTVAGTLFFAGMKSDIRNINTELAALRELVQVKQAVADKEHDQLWLDLREIRVQLAASGR